MLNFSTGPELAEIQAILDGTFLPLRRFVEFAWDVVEPGKVFVPGWHIDAICEHLEGVSRGWLRNLIINIPPRHMKSLTVSVFWPVWMWTYRPEFQWLFTSYAQDLALRDAVKSRRLIMSPWFQERWGSVFHLTGDMNQKSRYENNHSGYRISAGVGGQITGEGGDAIVADDPHKVKEAESDLMRTGVLEWWDQTMSTRLNDPKTGRKVIIMQRVHESDLTGHILSKMKDGDGEEFDLLILPAEYEPTTYYTSIGFRDPRTEPNELLWPERFGRPEIDSLKVSLGSRGSAGQLQQRPAPAEGAIFQRTWWKFWVPKSSNGRVYSPVVVRLPDGSVHRADVVSLPSGLELIQSWDMSFKDTEDSAFVAGQEWGARGSDYFLLDQVRRKMGLPDTVRAVRDLKKDYPSTGSILIEDKANGPAVIQTLRGEIPGLIAINPRGDKVARAHACSPFVESGNVYLPHPEISPWVWDFIEEAATFPNSTYADQVDSMTQVLIRLTRRQSRHRGRARSKSFVGGSI